MKANLLLSLILLFAGSFARADSAVGTSCNFNSYRNVIAACFKGRAEGGLELPQNENFGTYSGLYTSSWNFGKYNSSYAGVQFSPRGITFDSSKSVLPPYSWGAVGQICDQEYDLATHGQCESEVRNKLNSQIVNAYSQSGQPYWRSHGHNCHDAAEDVGFCLNRASEVMATGCGFDVKVIVWDDIPEIEKALGNVYHSQLLVKRLMQDSASGAQVQKVCLAESQIDNPSGLFSNNCCTSKLSLFDGGTIDEYQTAFGSCGQVLVWGPNPHVYDLKKFREQRKSGAMDVPSGYDRDAGRKVANGKPIYTRTPPRTPKLISAVYDKNGVAVMIIVR